MLLLLAGLTYLAQAGSQQTTTELTQLFERFLPTHDTGTGKDPFAAIELFLAGLSRARRTVSLYALPLFLWFSTRLFASIRTALTLVYDAPRRPDRHFALAYLAGKSRDAMMVLIMVVLFLANGLMSESGGVIRVKLQRLQQSWPALAAVLQGLGHLAAEAAAFGFGLALFYLVYRHASPRRLPRRAALAAAVFTSLLFELAKRLFGWYLHHVAVINRFSVDATIGALILFVLWLYYTALVFLIGAVVAETWDLRARQRRAVAEA